MPTGLVIGFVTGLTAEARIAARCGGLVRAGGGTSAGAELAARQLVAEGAEALISFGLAGGLDPAVRPGALVVPWEIIDGGVLFRANPALAARFGGLTGHRLLATEAVVSDASAKQRAAHANGAQVVDLESGAVARVATEHGLAFAVVRAICDPVERNLPLAALIALDQKGAIGLMRIAGSLLRHPSQLPNLLGLARDAARAQRTLIEAADRFSHRPPAGRSGSPVADPDAPAPDTPTMPR
jgi:adenosylhomocysteine nucleosidase